ncbi:MAG: pantetheine-phosphate adenylyltransferase [Bifidobacteriaceae bacterium]|jgi:pantetheine-phosphate adenylyltransferase|nr:pantetheine-phosphate adenylyltransferase [Bifidobacteriaceae bacterium]
MLVVYPGSFDPITLGHIDIIKRISNKFDQVIILVANNENKKTVFSLDERLNLIKQSLKESGVRTKKNTEKSNIRIEKHSGLLVDFVKQEDCDFIIRGLRRASDFDIEYDMARLNKHISGVETLLVSADPKFTHIASSYVKEIAKYGGDISGLVPEIVAQSIKQKF